MSNRNPRSMYVSGKKVTEFIALIELEARTNTAKNMLQHNRDRIAREFKESERAGTTSCV